MHGAGKKGQVWYYLDFISHAIFPFKSLFFLCLSPTLCFNGRGVLAGCDCLIYRYLLLKRGTRKRRQGLKMRCVFCRPQGQGALCVCGGWWITWGPRVYVYVCVCVYLRMVSSFVSLHIQWKHGTIFIFIKRSWKRSLNKANVCKWESPGINLSTILFWQ